MGSAEPITFAIDEKFRLIGFVCSPDCVRPVEPGNLHTFLGAFLLRPNMCRYGLAERIASDDDQRRFVCWDFYATAATTNGQSTYSGIAPQPLHTAPTEQALIMMTITRFSEE